MPHFLVPPKSTFHIPSNSIGLIALSLHYDYTGNNNKNKSAHHQIDINLSCVTFDGSVSITDAIFFNNEKFSDDSCSSLVHQQQQNQAEKIKDTVIDSNKVNLGEETLIFKLNKVPPAIRYMMVSVTSYTGADFTDIKNFRISITNLATKEVIAAAIPIVAEDNNRCTAALPCVLSRAAPNDDDDQGSSSWSVDVFDIACYGFTFCDVIPKMLDLLQVPRDQHDVCIANLPDYSLEKNNTVPGIGYDTTNVKEDTNDSKDTNDKQHDDDDDNKVADSAHVRVNEKERCCC